MDTIHILYEHSQNLQPHGSSYIRLLLPLTHPANEGNWIVSKGVYEAPADVMIVERMWKPYEINVPMAEELVAKTRGNRTCLIYTLDDNLLDLEGDHLIRPGLSQDQLSAIRYFAREAAGIIVSTEPLKTRLSRLNQNIQVVPNALDERLFDRSHRKERQSSHSKKRIIIGYMGTYTHDEDLMIVLQPLREVMRKHRDKVEFQLVGATAEANILDYYGDLPIKTLNIGINGEYPAFMRWMNQTLEWDIGIAPLEISDFSVCKSDIKFLDYGALGIPGIFTACVPYEKTVLHMQTGYLAQNTPESWIEGLESLLSHNELREQMANEAQEYVFSNRTLEHRAQDWYQAVSSIAAKFKS